jgi:hypothetical protein
MNRFFQFHPCRPVLLTAAALAGATVSCGTSSRPIVEFPSAQTVAQLGARPVAPPPSLDAAAVPSGTWTVDATLTATSADEAWRPENDVDRAFAAAAERAPHRPRLTRAMQCVARELGRFYLETKGRPPQALDDFITGACGAVWPGYGFRSLSRELGSSPPSDGELLQAWAPKIAEMAGQLPPAATDAGFWFGRAQGRAVAMVAYAAALAEVKPISLDPGTTGNLTFEGQLRENASYMVGYVNRGRYQVDACFVDPGVARPRFRITCHVDPGDRSAWIQLLYARPRRVLASPFMQLLARRPSSEPFRFSETAPAATEASPAAAPAAAPASPGGGGGATPDSFVQSVLSQLNAVRAQAQLPPVQLAAQQSSTATRLAAHYFAASLSKDGGAHLDAIALGLLAGWQVDGMIRDGNFTTSLVAYTRDPGRWLHAALERPLGRFTLLARDIDVVAIGPTLFSSPEGVGAVVTGYRLHRGADHADDVRKLYERLERARQRLGLAAPKRLEGLEALMRGEMLRVHQGKAQPAEAMQRVLDAASEKYKAGMRGHVLETTSLDALQLPAEVLRQPVLQMEMVVTHHRPPGAAWGQLVILVIYKDTSGSTS